MLFDLNIHHHWTLLALGESQRAETVRTASHQDARSSLLTKQLESFFALVSYQSFASLISSPDGFIELPPTSSRFYNSIPPKG
jgi:hypothetical protein